MRRSYAGVTLFALSPVFLIGTSLNTPQRSPKPNSMKRSLTYSRRTTPSSSPTTAATKALSPASPSSGVVRCLVEMVAPYKSSTYGLLSRKNSWHNTADAWATSGSTGRNQTTTWKLAPLKLSIRGVDDVGPCSVVTFSRDFHSLEIDRAVEKNNSPTCIQFGAPSGRALPSDGIPL